METIIEIQTTKQQDVGSQGIALYDSWMTYGGNGLHNGIINNSEAGMKTAMFF